jgi:type VI protein secretion system component VasF
MSAIRRTIAAEWADFEAHYQDSGISKEEIRQRRLVFYAGAAAHLSLIMSIIKNKPEHEIQAHLKQLADELAHFAVSTRTNQP